MKLWIVSMECAGIVEAGGVKNVTFSLCKEFSLLGHEVTLFIPVFKANSFDLIRDYSSDNPLSFKIIHCNKEETVLMQPAICNEGNFRVIFVNHPSFSQKEGVYTYTENEQRQNPSHIKGTGHEDTLFMDSLFAKSVAAYASQLEDEFLPDIVHCQDASCALVPSCLAQTPRLLKIKTVVTIHNAGPAYHHNFSSIGEAAWYTALPQELLCSGLNGGKVEPFLLAAASGASLTTVSEQYAVELTDPQKSAETEGLSQIFFERKISIKGITNGIDVERYEPSVPARSLLPFAYNPEKGETDGKIQCRRYFIENICNSKAEIPGIKKSGCLADADAENDVFISYHGRITYQKGISVLIQAIPSVLNNFDNVYFIIAGHGEVGYEKELSELTDEFWGRVVFLNGYNREVARLSNVAGDFIILPSFFEPCGLEDFIANIFGTIPVANRTGGLNKIVERKSGFLYTKNEAASVTAKLCEVITLKIYRPDIIKKMIRSGAVYVRKKYLWANVIKTSYLPFFKEILKKS